MINGHGDDLYKYNDIRTNFSSNVYSHIDHSGLFSHLTKAMENIISYPEPQPYSLENCIWFLVTAFPKLYSWFLLFKFI